MKKILLFVKPESFPAGYLYSPPLRLPQFIGAWAWRRYSRLLLIFLLLGIQTAAQAQDILAGLTTQGGVQSGGTAFTIKSDGTSFTIRKDFAKSGQTPYGDLIKGSDGNFYGMNSTGGNFGYGNIFKMSSGGNVTNIFSFNNTNGAYPQGSLKQGSDGSFYGMTNQGGTYGYGTIFKITSGGTLSILRHLNYSNDGGYPMGSLMQANDGNFYGLIATGGFNSYGTIFKLTLGGTYTVLRHLDYNTDGGTPNGSLVQATDGNLYGMTYQGGLNGYGTIFRITTGGTFTVRRHLNYSTDGGFPNGNSLIKGSDGNLYGMLYQGGSFGYGTIFKFTLGGTFTVLEDLDYSNDGGYPKGSLIQSTDGNFYGMTQSGGTYGYGTIFKCTPGGTLTILEQMEYSTDGGNARGSLVRNSSDGNFYGMTSYGGSGNTGTIFKITPSGTLTVLVNLPESSGINPAADLIQATDGNFYGMTTYGGQNNIGTAFKFCTSTFSTLRSFNTTNGARPAGSLVQGTDGNFYGMTYQGGSFGSGTVFKMTPGGTITVLEDLDYSNDGGYPNGSLIQSTDGNFYGMTPTGGVYGFGTIFKITPGGTLTVLWNLDGTNDGGSPYGNLTRGTDGNFYGMTYSGGVYGYGTIFKITPGGFLTVIKNFDYSNGAYPLGNGLVRGSDGNFYGLTYSGGIYGAGIIFKLTPGGTLTVLRNLNTTNDGGGPRGSLVQGSDGRLYGLASIGGTNNAGTIFKITTGGSFSIMRHLSPNTDGSSPLGSLVIQKANPVANAQSVTTALNTAKSITLTGSGGTPLTYTVVTQPLNGTLSGSGATRTYTPNTGFTGNDAFTFRVTWGCQQSSTKTVSITVGSGGPSTVRLNTGGPAVSVGLGAFSADAYSTGSTATYSNAVPIEGTTSDAIYQDYRRAATTGGSFGYTIPVTNGTYNVRLYFAEIAPSTTTTGQRVFNVSAEGVAWLANYDIVAKAGGLKKAVSETKSVTVSDGNLTLNFTSVVERACVAAIQITPVAARLDTDTPAEDIPELATSLYPNPAFDQVTVQLSQPTVKVATVVTDATGSQVLLNTHQLIAEDKVQVNVAPLKAGLYLLQLQTDHGFQTLKFVKE